MLNPSSSSSRGLYITVPIYFCLLLLCAIWAHRRNKEDAAAALKSRHYQQQHQASGTDPLSSHYLGGRSLGPILTTGTVFASFFSGYTVVGIPNEAFENGWLALRWLAGSMSIMLGYFGSALRLRKVALVRNHKTPIDFITDRFQSQILRYTVLILQLVPSMFYITAQVVALKSTANTAFGLDPDSPYPVIMVMGITLLFEWIGGLRCVAMTDCVQMFIMVVAYLCLPIIVVKYYGGWKVLTPETYPRPDFYQTPSTQEQMDFWQFTLSTASLFTLPHLLQRTYAAKDLHSLKTAFVTMAGGIWFLMVGAVFIGTMAVQILLDNNNSGNADQEVVESPFTEVLNQIIDLGGFPRVVGLLTITASFAAIMSTCDSLLVCISQLITEEVMYPLRPEASPEKMVWAGRAVSLVAVVIAAIMGLNWDDGVTDLATINYQLSAQLVLIFAVGLFGTDHFDCHPWILAFSATVGFVNTVALYFGYVNRTDTSSSDSPSLALNPGITGFLLQLFLVAILESSRRLFFPQHQRQVSNTRLGDDELVDDKHALIFPNRPSWDVPRRKRFGERTLTPNLVWKMMDGVHEPLANPWYVVLMVWSVSMVTPWVNPGMPTDLSDISAATIHGIPWWATKILALCAFPSVFICISLYNMPLQFPAKKTSAHNRYARNDIPGIQRTTSDLDPDCMELTVEEMGHRTAYDQRNDLVYKRRRQILEKLGLSPNEIDTLVESTKQQLQNFDPAYHFNHNESSQNGDSESNEA